MNLCYNTFFLKCAYTYWSSIWSSSHKTVSEGVLQVPTHVIQLSFTEHKDTDTHQHSSYNVRELIIFYLLYMFCTEKLKVVKY